MRLTLVGFLVVALAAAQLSAAAPNPEVEALLAKAGAFVASYGTRISDVYLEERVVISQLDAGRVASMRDSTSHVQFGKSDDGVATLRSLQSASSFPMHFGAQAFDPLLALRFLDERHQARITYKVGGRKRINNVRVVGLTFDEGKAVLGLAPLAGKAKHQSSGRIWIDPETGAIHRTELWVRSGKQTVTSNVDFVVDQRAGIPLPRSATHSLVYFQTETQSAPSKPPMPGARQTYEVSVTYSNK